MPEADGSQHHIDPTDIDGVHFTLDVAAGPMK